MWTIEYKDHSNNCYTITLTFRPARLYPSLKLLAACFDSKPSSAQTHHPVFMPKEQITMIIQIIVGNFIFKKAVWSSIYTDVHRLISFIYMDWSCDQSPRKSAQLSQSIDYQLPFNLSLITNDSSLCIKQKQHSSRHSWTCTVWFLCCSSGGVALSMT